MKRVAAALIGLALITNNPLPAPAQTTVPAKKGAQLDGTLNDTLDSAKDQSRTNPPLRGATIDGHLENAVIDDIKRPDGTLVTPVSNSNTVLKRGTLIMKINPDVLRPPAS